MEIDFYAAEVGTVVCFKTRLSDKGYQIEKLNTTEWACTWLADGERVTSSVLYSNVTLKGNFGEGYWLATGLQLPPKSLPDHAAFGTTVRVINTVGVLCNLRKRGDGRWEITWETTSGRTDGTDYSDDSVRQLVDDGLWTVQSVTLPPHQQNKPMDEKFLAMLTQPPTLVDRLKALSTRGVTVVFRPDGVISYQGSYCRVETDSTVEIEQSLTRAEAVFADD